MTNIVFQTRIENKYVVKNAAFLQSILQAHFLPDPMYPSGQVNTLHFETIDLDGIEDKRNGEYYKNKLRLRWYGEESTAQLPEKVFLENKMTIRKEKKKSRTLIELNERQRTHPFDASLWRETIEQNSCKLNFKYTKPLFPIMISKYQRSRYHDPLGNNRISLDREIQVTQYSPEMKASGQSITAGLSYSVLEIKGETDRLPLAIRNLDIFKLTAISKFEKLFNNTLQISR